MAHYVIPSEFLFWSANPHHEQHKRALLPKIQASLPQTDGQQKGAWFCDVNTEFFVDVQDTTKYTDLITEAIYPALDAMFAEVKNLRLPHSSAVNRIWYNHYSGSGRSGQEVHTHTACSYSGVYFLELYEPNTTMFYSHSAAVNEVTLATKTTEFIKEGDILLFPATLMHYVLPPSQPRSTVAFNIVCSYEN